MAMAWGRFRERHDCGNAAGTRRAAAARQLASSSAVRSRGDAGGDEGEGAHDRRRRATSILHAAAAAAPAPSAEEAVNNILYNAPPSGRGADGPSRHVLNCLVSNEPGVLSRVSGILAGRGFNIESLVVARTEVADLSRMTIVLYGRDGQVEQARRQLEDIVPVWAVLDYTHAPVLEREILLAKVSTVPPELLAAAARRDSAAAGTDALEGSSMQRQAISGLAALFGAKIVDVTLEAVTVELSAKPRRIDAFVALLRPYGIVEAARSGAMAMARTPLARADPAAAAAAAAADAAGGAAPDATQLPPG